ncbi:MAG: cbb3-type cytochrome c oxidase subunit 3 [Ignavibacteriaceae bacterium]|jgi:cytochrome c oxidase cbb3-type subunit IV
MIRNYLQSIEGVELYPLVSLIIFVLFFVAIFVWMVKIDKKYLKEMAEMPLDLKTNGNLNSTGESDNIQEAQ